MWFVHCDNLWSGLEAEDSSSQFVWQYLHQTLSLSCRYVSRQSSSSNLCLCNGICEIRNLRSILGSWPFVGQSVCLSVAAFMHRLQVFYLSAFLSSCVCFPCLSFHLLSQHLQGPSPEPVGICEYKGMDELVTRAECMSVCVCVRVCWPMRDRLRINSTRRSILSVYQLVRKWIITLNFLLILTL